MLVQPNDLVEFGRETQYKNEKVRKLGFVTDIRGNKILVKPAYGSGKAVTLDPSNLYEADLDKMPAVFRQQPFLGHCHIYIYIYTYVVISGERVLRGVIEPNYF